jgi:hypothetical protein
MGSFGLLNTNVGLTTNVKIMVDSNYKLSLDSIESNDRLSLDRYKKFSFNKRSLYDEIIPLYYKETPIELAYYISYNNDVDVMSNDFKDQYDELYNYGAKNIINNKSYSEEYEYFAPIYIKKENLPEGFIVFRVDGAGLGIINKENFRSEILEKFKVVKLFDLTPKTPIGEWLDLNFRNNSFFPKTPLEVDFRSLEFTKWNGIDFNTGGYSSKSFFMDDIFETEQEIFELEKTFFENYKNNGLVFPNILNLTFLFDDEPSTPDIKRKWSINRYYGFYLDNVKIEKKVTPYKSAILREDVVIQEGNILYSNSSPDNPFIEEWSDEKPFYVELNGDFYLVERFTRSGGISIQKIVDDSGNSSEEYADIILVKYKIISDIDLQGKESELNNNFVYIENNLILDSDRNPFILENFETADVWIIEIDGIYHNLIKDENDNIKIFTDYTINSSDKNFEYRVGGVTKKVSTIVDFRNSPKLFKIYKLNFTDIKSFDNRIIDTEYSRFEYEQKEDITQTDETKMYVENLLSNDNPKSLDDFVYKEEVVNIPVASEYTANWETFKIKNGDLSDIWRVNPVYCKWGYQNSISQNDVPYLLNNSLVFEDFNRAPNVIETNPIRSERNLDYFYSVNSSTSSYINHSLHVEKVDNGEIDESFNFELGKYLNLDTYLIGTQSATYSFNYFKYFFERKAHFDQSNLLRNVKKYSKFNEGDNIIPNMTVFKGIDFRIYDVESIILDDNNNIENINLKTSNEFQDYDFSVLLSDNRTINKNCDCITIKIIDNDNSEFNIINLFKTNTLFNDVNTFEGSFNGDFYEIKYDGINKWILYKNNIPVSELIMEEFMSCPVGEWENLDCCLDMEICITSPSGECNFTMILCVNPMDDNTCIEVPFTLIEEDKWISENIPIAGSTSTFDGYIENVGGTWSFIYSKDEENIPIASLTLKEDSLCPIGEWVLEEIEEECCLIGYEVNAIYDFGTLTYEIELSASGSYWVGIDTEAQPESSLPVQLYFDNDQNEWLLVYIVAGFEIIMATGEGKECPTQLIGTPRFIGLLVAITGALSGIQVNSATFDFIYGDDCNSNPTGYNFLKTNLSETLVKNCYGVKFEKEGEEYIGVLDIEVDSEISSITFSIFQEENNWLLKSDDDNIASIITDSDCPSGDWLITNEEYSNLEISTINSCDLNGKLLTSSECENISSNELRWLITEEWKMDKQYNEGDIVVFDDIFYIAITPSFTENPIQTVSGVSIKSAPFNLPEWQIYTNNGSPLWNPQTSNNSGYSTSSNSYIYNNGEYYEYVGGSEDFWNPINAMNTGYGLGDVVLYKGKYYFSMTSSNHYTIDTVVGLETDITVSWKKPVNKFFTPWVATQSSNNTWNPIRMWNPSESYLNTDLVVHNDILWISNDQVEPGEEPGASSYWVREYSLEPDFTYIYLPTNNPVIILNNRYYICNSNITNSALDNGIVIYINKKWKNILVNINVSDNTLPNLSNHDRDDLYTELYYKLTANNFIQCINDITNRYGYSNYLKYVVIDEENNITEHSYINNITTLKYILEAGYPDQFTVKVNSLDRKPLVKPNTLNPTRVLNNFKVDLISKLNWYNNLPISVSIEENLSEVKRVNNLHGLVNITTNDLYRFSGYYMPIFYDIELFKKTEDFEEIGNWKFDTSLTDFGILKERKIRKINRKDSILKLKDDQESRSIYPMLDEFGLTTLDFFIFKSTWDYKYYLESDFVSLNIINKPVKENVIIDNKNFGKAPIIQNQNKNI